jgi:hypothetical protein
MWDYVKFWLAKELSELLVLGVVLGIIFIIGLALVLSDESKKRRRRATKKAGDERILDWLFGTDCPLECGRRIVGWWSHNCPKLAGKTSARQVRVVSDLARTTMLDMSADKDVHSAYLTLEELDAVFPEDSQ